MSSSYFGISSAKSRRSSPGESQGALFQTGQGGRTVLPPISSAFPTSRFPGLFSSIVFKATHTQCYCVQCPHTLINLHHVHLPQDMKSINKLSITTGPLIYVSTAEIASLSFPPTTFNLALPPATEPTSSFSNYETHDRYSTQPLYSFPARTSSPIPANNSDSRKLPPLNTSHPSWQSYMPTSSNYQSGVNIVRSPTASYPAEYACSTHAGSYTYLSTQDQDQVQIPSLSSVHVPTFEAPDYSRSEQHTRSSSPHGRSSFHIAPRPPTPPPLSPLGPEEGTIKKKRKRADANQLKVLNETYNRTAFPSTEERLHLAKVLEMSPRSVQIWYTHHSAPNEHY
jgi:homeobox protein YOX1/YHP1